MDDGKTLLELPLTSAFWGMLRRQGGFIYPRLWRAPVMRGVLARLGLLERVPLTPEGVSVEEAIRGIDIALDDGLPVLVLSFHSPSLRPGSTPYVRDEDDLDALYDWWRRIFAYLKQRGVKPSSVHDVMSAWSDSRRPLARARSNDGGGRQFGDAPAALPAAAKRRARRCGARRGAWRYQYHHPAARRAKKPGSNC